MLVAMNKRPFTNDQIFAFINRAGKATYAGDGAEVENPERPGFKELEYEEGEWTYRDSYTGYYRSRGMEVVRFKREPVWTSLYGGGMIAGKEDLADKTFSFLKKAMSADEENFLSFRGPHELEDSEWRYNYKQNGDVFEFHGYEEIYFKGELVFFHRILGGVIDND